MMRAWLADWGASTDTPEMVMGWMGMNNGAGMPAAMKPGLASDDEMRELAIAEGPAVGHRIQQREITDNFLLCVERRFDRLRYTQTTSEHLTIQLHCRDALLSMDVPSVERELNALLRHQSRVDGYEASLRSVLGVLRGGKGAGPRPQPPAPEPEPPAGSGSGSDGPVPEPEPRASTQQERAATKWAQLLEAHPYVAEALEAGRITTEQAEAICKAALPDEVKRQLLAGALSQSTDATLVAIKEAIAAGDQADSEAKFRRQRANRTASWGKGDDGMYWIRALLDPVTGAAIIDALDALLTKETQTNRNAKPTEIRTFAHMCADALAAALTGEARRGGRG
jgi:hypothetical protein